MSSLFDFALAGYLGEVSGEEQMYQRVLSFNLVKKIRRGIAAQKKAMWKRHDVDMIIPLIVTDLRRTTGW